MGCACAVCIYYCRYTDTDGIHRTACERNREFFVNRRVYNNIPKYNNIKPTVHITLL